jgi:hypothetical protein
MDPDEKFYADPEPNHRATVDTSSLPYSYFKSWQNTTFIASMYVHLLGTVPTDKNTNFCITHVKNQEILKTDSHICITGTYYTYI